MAKVTKKTYDDINVNNIEEILSTLTEEELEQLGQELIDPDDPCIPPSERCRYQTKKAPTGNFNRKALLDFIEKKAREEKDWDEAKPYKREIRGKVWKPKALERTQVDDDIEVDTEWDEVLASATEEELVDLAAILGFHGMLNQVQYHNAFVDDSGDKKDGTGFQGVARSEEFKLFDEEPPNQTDVDAGLDQLKANDPKLKELNLNNLKNISIERLVIIAETLETNTSLERLRISNTRATDKVAKTLAKSLEKNKTLQVLDMESNYISGGAIVTVLEAINVNKVVTEFRVSNQRPSVLGSRVESEITQLVKENISLLKFNIFMETSMRVRVEEFIKRNNDNLRRGRIGEDLVKAPEPAPKFVYKPKEKKETEAPKPEAKTVTDLAEESEDDEDESEEESETEESEEE